MKLKTIPVDKCAVPEVRVTAVYDEETQRLLRETIAAMGILQPIIVVLNGEKYDIVDGLHRWQEAKAQGHETIQAVVYEGGPQDALLMNLVLNKTRGKTKASEMVRAMKSLYEAFGLDVDKVAAKTGFKRDYIERLLRISAAAPSVQDALDREVISVGHAYEIARLGTYAAQDEIIAKYAIWKWPIKDLHDQIEQVLAYVEQAKQPPLPLPPPEKPVYHCEGCKTQADLNQLRPVLLCPPCYGVVWHAAKTPAQTVPSGVAPDGVEAEKPAP